MIRALICRYNGHNAIEKFMEKLHNTLHNLFWFVRDPRILPTNNAAERGLRYIDAQENTRRHKGRKDELGLWAICSRVSQHGEIAGLTTYSIL